MPSALVRENTLAPDDPTLEFDSEAGFERDDPKPTNQDRPPAAVFVAMFTSLAALVALAVGSSGLWTAFGQPAPPAARGSLRVASDPQGAEVRIDGALRGRTPVVLSLPAGTYALTVRQGSLQRQWPVEITSGVAKDYHLTWVDAAPAGSAPTPDQPAQLDEERQLALVTPGYSRRGRINGNKMTSRIDGLLVSTITRRSIPTPSPPAGGRPYSRARM